MSELAEVLRAWRDRVRPHEVGLRDGGRRRAPGLRREELAALAGVSVEYVICLEQGRARHPSVQMLGALARALRLSEQERDHLYRLGGVAEPARALVPRHVSRGVQRMIDRLGDVPLAVHSAAWDLLWWNPVWAVLTGDPSGLRGAAANVAWRHFMLAPGVIDFDAVHAEEFSADLVADLRQTGGRYPEDRALQELVAALRAGSGDFDRRWGRAHVAQHRSSTKTATSTPVGPVVVDCDVLTVPDGDLRIVIYTAAPGSADASKLDLLRVGGLQHLAG